MTVELDDITVRLRAQALRPEDTTFTHRVLAALPPRRASEVRRRSFLLATRAGIGLAIIVAMLKGYLAGASVDTSIAILLVAAPVVAALARLCGPLVPGRIVKLPRLMARDWR